LESGMFRRWIDKPCRLELVNLPQPLHPIGVDDVPFGHFAAFGCRRKGNVAMNRVLRQVFAVKVIVGERVAWHHFSWLLFSLLRALGQSYGFYEGCAMDKNGCAKFRRTQNLAPISKNGVTHYKTKFTSQNIRK